MIARPEEFTPAVVFGTWAMLRAGRLALTPTNVWGAALLSYKMHTCRDISAGSEGYDTYSAFQALLPPDLVVDLQRGELAVCAAQPTWGCIASSTRFDIVEEVWHGMGVLDDFADEMHDAAKHSLLVPELDDEEDNIFAHAVCWAALFQAGASASIVQKLVHGMSIITIVKYGMAIVTATLPGVPGTLLDTQNLCQPLDLHNACSGNKRKFGQLI